MSRNDFVIPEGVAAHLSNLYQVSLTSARADVEALELWVRGTITRDEREAARSAATLDMEAFFRALHARTSE